ncbi:MAG TPA: glycerophosphodiester phosphodiesterase family protein [Steroidobacteraceae bacterium]|nr:glycerophosphodiester phosphodiesterase family protein [Steroidobacteraceae bacterium]
MNQDLIRHSWSDLTYQLRAALAFQLLAQLASLALISPLLTWFARRLMLLSGEPVVSNYAIVGFLASPGGVGLAALLAVLLSGTLFVQFAGQTWIARAAIARQRVSAAAAVAAVVRRWPGLLQLSARMLLRLVLLALPCVAGAYLVWTRLLGDHDINYYLAARPPQWRHALLAGAGLAAAYALLVLGQLSRWIYAIPILMCTPASPSVALAASVRMSRGRLLKIIGPLLAWWVLLGASGAAVSLFVHKLESLGLAWAGLYFARVLPLVTLFVIAGLVGSFLWDAVLIAGHQFLVTRMYSQSADPAAREVVAGEDGTVARRMTCKVLLVTGVLLAGGLVFMWRVAARGASEPQVAVTAHRGDSSHAPENSLAAFRAAIAAHADFSELDVQRTRDGVVVVLHDGDLLRLADDPRKIGDLTLQDLAAIDIGRKYGPAFAGEHVPTLVAVIALVRGRMKLNIELKYNAPDPQLAAATLDVLRSEQFLDQVVITSLSAAALKQVREIEPHARIGQIVTVAVGDVAKADTDFLSLNSARATPAVIHRAHAAGKAVHVWTVNRAEVMLRMIERRADNLITDDPGLAVRVLRQHGALTDAERLALRLRVLFSTPPAEMSDPQAVPTL